jgi:hypothetical protein
LTTEEWPGLGSKDEEEPAQRRRVWVGEDTLGRANGKYQATEI